MNATLLAVVINVATASASNHHAASGRASTSRYMRQMAISATGTSNFISPRRVSSGQY